jgi:hypothetical protein
MTKKMKKYEAIIKLTKNQILKIIYDEPFTVYHKYIHGTHVLHLKK